VAHWLRDRGFEGYAVRGGIAGLQGRIAAEPEAIRDSEVRRERALAALRHALFRRYSTGLLLSLIGKAGEAASFGYVVLLLGGSAATLGLIGFLNTIPNLALALPAGALADKYDRRALLIGFQLANMAVAVLLAVLWATDLLTVPLMGALAIVGGCLGTLSFPAFQGLLASTVPRRDLESAVAINSLSLQLARFVGPAIAGYLLATGGPAWVFGANAVSFLAVIGAVASLPRARALAVAGAERLGGAMMDGLRFVFGQRSLSSLMVLMLLAGIFGTPPVAFMIPAIVRFQLHGGGGTLGAVMAAIGLGSVLGSLALLRLSRRANKGEPLMLGYLLTALAVVGIGVSTSLPLSLFLAVAGGLFGVIFVGLSTVIVQAMSTDEVRARAMAIWAGAFVGMLPVGALVTAGLTAWLGPGGAVTVDGLVVLVGGIAVLLVRPEIRWLGCAALPEACVAATNPLAVMAEEEEREPVAA
jgi:MFS family permease